MRLWATIKKDVLLLCRDRVGLALLFGMPVALVLLVTAIQNNAFPGGNGEGPTLLIQNRDTGRFSRKAIDLIRTGGHFRLVAMDGSLDAAALQTAMKSRQAIMTVLFPANFSAQVSTIARHTTNRSLRAFGLEEDTIPVVGMVPQGAVELLFHPGVDPREKTSTEHLLNGVLQGIQSQETLRLLYFSINGRPLPDSLAEAMTGERIAIREFPPEVGDTSAPLNATQHNVPAWTIFAMFFVVMSLGGSVVKEKSGGTIVRLKTLPTNFLVALASKELVYLGVTFLQALVIFALGVWAFPLIGLPALQLPADAAGLILITLLCGWCAVSYALLVGVFARTQEQSNGFGAISVVILAIIGGLMVPAFIMPDAFKGIMRFSPLHWALECYYGLFVEGSGLSNILINILPLGAITLLMQLLVVAAIKRKGLI